jgi:hypothetical protein
MNDEQQDRPPWLRNLRPMAEAAALEAMPAMDDPDLGLAMPDLSFESSPSLQSGFNRRHLLLLAVLLWTNVAVLGCLCLLATQRVVL